MENVREVWTNTAKTALETLKGSLLLRMLSFLLVAGLSFYAWTVYEDCSAQKSISNVNTGFAVTENGQREKTASKGKSSKDVPGLALAKSTKQLSDPFDATRLGAAVRTTGAGANSSGRSKTKNAGLSKQGALAQLSGRGQQLVDTNSAGEYDGSGAANGGTGKRNTELKGIVHSLNGDGAIIEINGKQQTLLLGETLGTVTLLALGEASATLSIEDEEMSLSMKG